MGNTDLWDRLGKTDPKHTKPFSRAGGFKGTAIKPMFSFHRMTEEFGACGVGWGVNEPTFQVAHVGDDVLVYCTVSIWHGQRENTVFGVGGDKVAGKNKNGLFTDDEAFKKAFTDAVTNALKLIGVGADVHMGLFDDNKYVSEARAEFAEKRQNPHVTRADDISDTRIEYDQHGNPIDSIPLAENPVSKMRVKDARPEYAELIAEMDECTSTVKLEKWGRSSANTIGGMSENWQEIIRRRYTERLNELRKEVAA